MSAFFLSDIGNANGVPQAESNSAIIGGVQHFYVDTKPIERPNGDPLVIGDRWWKTDEGTEWFWNGTYWLSVQTQKATWPTSRNGGYYRINLSDYAASSPTEKYINIFDGNDIPSIGYNPGFYTDLIFTDYWTLWIGMNGIPQSDDRYAILTPGYALGAGAWFSDAFFDTRETTGGGGWSVTTPIKEARFSSFSSGMTRSARLWVQAVGTGTIDLAFSITYRVIYL